jgi:hypothetical protein
MWCFTQPPYANAYKQTELPAAHPLRVMGDMLGGAAHRLTPEQLHKVCGPTGVVGWAHPLALLLRGLRKPVTPLQHLPMLVNKCG